MEGITGRSRYFWVWEGTKRSEKRWSAIYETCEISFFCAIFKQRRWIIPFRSVIFFFSPSPSSSSLSLLFSFLIPFHLVSVSSFLLLLFRLFLFLPNNRLVAERLAARSRRRKEKKEKKEKTNASVNKWINKDFWSSLPVFFTNSSNSLSQSISQPFRVSLLLAFQNSHYHIYF